MLTACNALWLSFDSEPERQCSENRATLIFEPGKTFQSLSEKQLRGDRHRAYESSCYALKGTVAKSSLWLSEEHLSSLHHRSRETLFFKENEHLGLLPCDGSVRWSSIGILSPSSVFYALLCVGCLTCVFVESFGANKSVADRIKPY
jgi:hypothetical protein